MYNDPDLFFALGLVLAALSFPALLRTFTHHTGMSTVMVLVVLSAGCISAALIQKPSGYTVHDAPKVVMDVFQRMVN